MSDGKWSGGAANRAWIRPGSRYRRDGLSDDRRHELYEQMAGESFYCEACGGHHPLREHQACRSR